MLLMHDAASDADMDRELRDSLGDIGRAFFNFPSLSAVQRAAIPPIRDGRNTLVCAATASGKTEALLAPLVWRVRRTGGGHGIRLLAIAPTRALVADLKARLEKPLALFGWRAGAQTSDFREAEGEPEVLVTTPESLDSMLVRRAYWQDDRPAGHLLAHVSAVFVDEAHLFDASPRGEQVMFLLERLRRLRAQAFKQTWTADATLQVCAASATVPEPHDLARRLLGADAEAVVCKGARELHVMSASGEWLLVSPDADVTALRDSLPRISCDADVAAQLWKCLNDGTCRKALVFVNARAHCDTLAKLLRERLRKHREMWVGGHHGSLSRNERLVAESAFHRERDAVLVATMTLEVGVDIGDVDLVALVGPPPDVPALLQRIGRGGRRTNSTRVAALARSFGEAAALASELCGAVHGCLELRPRFRRWDVFPQQVVSYIRQNRTKGRVEHSIVELTGAVWPHQSDTATLAEAALQHWLTDGLLEANRARLHLAGEWDRFTAGEKSDASAHSNIGDDAPGMLVRDSANGEFIAEVFAVEGSQITIAGQSYRVVRLDEGASVRPLAQGENDAGTLTPNYGGRRRPVTHAFATHIRNGCGIAEPQTPLIFTPSGWVWLHFGGEIQERLLCALLPSLFIGRVIGGIALQCSAPFKADALLHVTASTVNRWVQSQGLRALGGSLGRWSEHLPVSLMEAMLSDASISSALYSWVSSRAVATTFTSAQEQSLHLLLNPEVA